MKIKTYFFVPVITILISFGTYAQTNSNPRATLYYTKRAVDFYQSKIIQNGNWKTILTENDIEGSPYLNGEFEEGAVYTKSKDKYVNVPLRYNIYNDEVEFKATDERIQAIATPEIIDKVEFGDYEIIYAPFTVGKKVEHGYFIVLEKGNASLYRKPRIAFEDAKKPAPYQDAQPAKFVRKSDEIYMKVGNEAATVVGSKRSLTQIFPNHSSEIKTYIKKNKIKAGNVESLKELVKYYNSL